MTECLACGRPGLEPVVDLGSAPAFVGAAWPDESSARQAPQGRLDLVVCPTCGHVANQAFDAGVLEYDGAYDNSLHHSPTFRSYEEDLIARLRSRYGLDGGHVVEVGSGKGEFLASLTAATGGTATGYDPTCGGVTPAPGVTLVPAYYRPDVDLEGYDLLACRHVLEHLDDPVVVLRAVRDGAPADAVLYLEVPSAEFNFGPDGMWDVIYPHVSYFSADSLRTLVRRCGLEVLDEGRSFAGQFLWVEARRGPVVDETPQPPVEHLERVRRFGAEWPETVLGWRDRIASNGGDVALWGAGSKGVVFLNAVDPDVRLRVIDVNPRKQGTHVPGTGHLVERPEVVGERPPELVLITNPVYRDEIEQQLRSMGVGADVVAV